MKDLMFAISLAIVEIIAFAFGFAVIAPVLQEIFK